MKYLITFAIALGLIGCAAPQKLNTSSGRPEIYIENTTKKQITEKLVESSISRGHDIKSVTEYTVVSTKIIDSLMASVLFGSKYDAQPYGRTTYTLLDFEKGVKVFGKHEALTNAFSAFERSTDVTGSVSAQMQEVLQTIKLKLEIKP